MYKDKLIAGNVKVFVRRGGPNYQNGLQMMADCGERTGISIEVFGPEIHLTSVISYALGVSGPPEAMETSPLKTDKAAGILGYLSCENRCIHCNCRASGSLRRNSSRDRLAEMDRERTEPAPYELFNPNTVAAVYGMQPKAVQNMLDFDHLCSRKQPSVACMIYPFSGNHFQKFYWGANEILIPGS